MISRWWSAATPAEIAAELNGLLRDPEVRAIVANDGGQTVLGYLDLIDGEAIRAEPKPILGYSASRCCIWCYIPYGAGALPANSSWECWRLGVPKVG